MFKRTQGEMRLMGHVVLSETLHDQSTCGLRCLQTLGCHSINYHSKTGQCEMNRNTEKTAVHVHALSESTGWIHLQVAGKDFE